MDLMVKLFKIINLNSSLQPNRTKSVDLICNFMKKVETFDDFESMDQESRYLVHKAKEAAQQAYAPYSKFHVGAALILEDGTLVTGSNQENASYPLCMCGERVALYAAVSLNPGKRIEKLAVVAHRKNQKELVAATPCGACRQVMHEFEERQKKSFSLVLYGPLNKWYVFPSASDLLPMAFDKDSLGR